MVEPNAMSGDYYVGICGACHIAVPMDVRQRDAWDAKHLHLSDDEDDE